METASPQGGALECAATETGIPATELDWSQPLELVTDTAIIPVELCPPDRLPSFVETNPDSDGDYWLLFTDQGGAAARLCSAADGDAHPWGAVRNGGAQVPA